MSDEILRQQAGGPAYSLHIDTLGERARLTLLDSTCTIIADVVGDEPRGAAEEMVPLMRRLFDKAVGARNSINQVVVLTGPGNFTSIRLGLATAKGFGVAKDIPVKGVSRFEQALACAVRIKSDISALLASSSDSCIAVLVRGRGKSGFLQKFSVGCHAVRACHPAASIEYEEVLKQETNTSAVVLCDWGDTHTDFAAGLGPFFPIIPAPQDSLAAMLLLGRGTADPSFTAEPCYVRVPNAKAASRLFQVSE